VGFGASDYRIGRTPDTISETGFTRG
jgi:hypothetical protein